MTELLTTPPSTSLDDRQRAALPTEDVVAFYEEHGWWVSPPVLGEDLLEDVARAVERYHRGERDAAVPAGAAFSDWRPGDPGPVRVNMHVSLQSAVLRRLVLQPVLGAIAARLARTPEIRLFEDELIHKEPNPDAAGGGTGWHTDWSYTSTCRSSRTLTAWTPLHDVDVDRGPLVVLDRSHRWPATEHLRLFHDQDLGGALDRFAAAGHDVVEVPIVLRRGQVSFHHCSTVHGSYPNRSTRPRTAVAAHLQDRDNEYRDYVNGDRRIHHVLDDVCRTRSDGTPDYSDPAVFPVVWREPTDGGAV